MPEQRLWAWWNRRLSRQERPTANRKLSEDQELAICQYLDRLDTIRTSARLCSGPTADPGHPRIPRMAWPSSLKRKLSG